MTWIEVASGRFEREFGALENFYRAIAAAAAPIEREHFQLHCIAKINPILSEAELQSAWKALRYHHPLLAGFEEDGKYVYQVPDAAALEQWVSETCHYFAVDDESPVDDFRRSPKPVQLVHIFFLGSTGELVIQSSHWRMDGLGIMTLINELLNLVANPVPTDSLQWNSEQTLMRLTPAVEELIKAPKEATEERQNKAKRLMDIVSLNRTSTAFKTLPNQLPAATGRLNTTFSEEETSKIIKACKARGITVSVGLHAAQILAGQRLEEARTRNEDEKYVYMDLLTFSVRKHLPPPFNGKQVPVTNYHTGFPVAVDVLSDAEATSFGAKPLNSSSLSFSHLASELAKTYSFDAPGMFDYFIQWVDAIVAFYATPPSPDDPPPPAHADLSSLGILEDNLQREYKGKKNVELLHWAVTVEMLDKHVMCHCWTYKGRLELQALWNEAFYDQEFISNLLEEWKAIVLKELV